MITFVILYIVAAYLLGAIPFGYLAGRLNGIDLREHGSHNIGATNVVRVLGKTWGIPVFILDFLKGYLPVILSGSIIDMWATCGTGEIAWLKAIVFVLVSFATVLGHTYTCFLGFKGGKGVATTAGVLMALSFPMFAIALATWVVALLLFRYVSVASITSAIGMVVGGGYAYGFFKPGGLTWRPEVVIIGFLVAVAALVIVRHRSNIVRIMSGTEPKVFSRK